ncbi:MAG: hypothetical protein HN350_03950 [Phycisphaerales bacterium]|jgi:hypothetical protein|nr:hypothetical protein [Phycisphaerales bacterium]
MAYVFALAMLALCTSLTVALASGINMNIARSENMQKVLNAQLTAESGLAFMLQAVSQTGVSRDTDYDTLMSNLATELGELLDDTPNLNSQTVSGDETTVTIPAIAIGSGAFSCVLTRLSPDSDDNQQCRITVTGTADGLSRTLSIDMRLKLVPPGAFDYGVATKGTIAMSGNAKIRSLTDAEDANIFSAAAASTVVSANGNPELDGDIYACTDNIAAINLTGNVEVGGENDLDEILAHHVHLEEPAPDFPELDLTPFAALATTEISKSTKTNNKTFSNVRVLANANPTFNGNTTLNGIVYVEAPNKIKFNGNLVINGFIVTADGSDLSISGNELTFNGNLSVNGVESLPDTAEFAAVKEYKGTAILAPGFALKFSGNNSGIDGMIAADQLTFTGNSTLGGELTGIILGLKNLPMVLRGNTEITINRDDDDYLPAGFKYTSKFNVTRNTYSESNGQ